ncbi:MAG: hypothetical protein HPY74_20170 [Firmicutes bacterium]|nr:hypothetical protein [Bacillota bacterium]
MFSIEEPSQPNTANYWAFIDELRSELHRKPRWNRYDPNPGELDLRNGVIILKNFPDPEGLLDTAWEDLERFMDDVSVPRIGDLKSVELKSIDPEHVFITIQAIQEEQVSKESYCIEIGQSSITIKSEDTEGIRRGIFYLEDLILSAEGPFLTPTTIKRIPWVKNRISRCFFGPIKRLPFNRDELMDEVDYYPDEYLNRLAHEGINILWLTIEFRDLCKTNIVPEYGKNREKRLSKLSRTVEKCRRYGIKIFLFCIEPRLWGDEDPLLLNHPEVAGAKVGNDICFCPFSETSQKYLYEAVKSIFLDVPKLGGIICITHGERTTSCLSSVSAVTEAEVNCPRCLEKEKGEILEATHIPILRAMHEVNPDAQFISWLYMPQVLPTAQWTYTIPAKLPKDTILVFNFESGGEKEQLGKIRIGGDYWQSYIGPSHRFTGMALACEKAGIEMGAKIQVAPTWRLDFPASGDSIGECMISFTIKEAIELCEKMVDCWKKGVEILKEISHDFADDPERLKDIGVAEALSIQFESGLNILRFYDLRDQILWNNPFDQTEFNQTTLNQTKFNRIFNRIKCLDEMEAIVKEEIKRSLRMIELCKYDSQLGFHWAILTILP